MFVFFLQTSTTEERSPVAQLPSETVTSLSREEKREMKIDEMKLECENLRSNLDDLQANVKQLTTKLSQVNLTLTNAEKEVERSEERRKIKARTYDLLPNGEENIKKLEAMVEASANKLANLASQWERHRRPLIERYREERAKYSTKAVSIKIYSSFIYHFIFSSYVQVFRKKKLIIVIKFRAQVVRSWTS